jgi:phosphatidylethanolamine/phosphatidyl-N-methylethanolamine N-methyltransferase
VGTGLTFKHLPYGIDFTGVDLSEKMLLLAKKRAEEQKRDFKLLEMDASKLAFPDESFDLIISAHFLSATSNPVPALQEMRRVVKKTGRILLVNNFQRSEKMSIFEPIAKKLGFSLKLNLNELCLKTGLHVQTRKRVNPVLPIDAAILTR